MKKEIWRSNFGNFLGPCYAPCINKDISTVKVTSDVNVPFSGQHCTTQSVDEEEWQSLLWSVHFTPAVVHLVSPRPSGPIGSGRCISSRPSERWSWSLLWSSAEPPHTDSSDSDREEDEDKLQSDVLFFWIRHLSLEVVTTFNPKLLSIFISLVFTMQPNFLCSIPPFTSHQQLW